METYIDKLIKTRDFVKAPTKEGLLSVSLAETPVNIVNSYGEVEKTLTISGVEAKINRLEKQSETLLAEISSLKVIKTKLETTLKKI